jgi:RNA polymerase sigma factor (sigma-70 family)
MIFTQDSRLFARLRAGEVAAFESVMCQHYESVWRQLYLLCQDPEKAADLTQETFIEAWCSVPKFAGRSKVRTWLYTIAVRVWQRKGRSLPETALSEEAWEAFPDASAITESVALQTLFSEAITGAIGRLPEDLRVIVVLHYRQEMTQREIATALQIPLGTVKSRQKEALRRLRVMLYKEEIGEMEKDHG